MLVGVLGLLVVLPEATNTAQVSDAVVLGCCTHKFIVICHDS